MAMYNVNIDQIEQRLAFIPQVVQVAGQLIERWDGSLINSFAQERVLHITIEMITDVGNLIIDGFLMRDAGSYEDIIDIIVQERVIPPDMHASFSRLISLRKMLMQQYIAWERNDIHPMLTDIVKWLPLFAISVRQFLVKAYY